jgi:hypothetical protein
MTFQKKSLFERSNHPQSEWSEVYVTYLTNVSIDNNVVDAIGIFKSDLEADFLQFEKKQRIRNDFAQQVSGLDKLDKDVLSFDIKGYKNPNC